MNHPHQPLENRDGTIRFKENAIVRHLLEFGRKHGCGLHELEGMDFAEDDRRQFAQLIGYSLRGYLELEFVDADGFCREVQDCGK